ncbi:hypothetical protein ACROYT_G014218 [Oculina patagonica]
MCEIKHPFLHTGTGEQSSIGESSGNCQLKSKGAKGTRFDFDPRALDDRKVKKIEDLDLEGLRRASDDKAAILKFFPKNSPFGNGDDLHCQEVQLIYECSLYTSLDRKRPGDKFWYTQIPDFVCAITCALAQMVFRGRKGNSE